jgi:WD40 repeat protein
MIWDVAFSPNGLHVATASADGTARIWRVERTLAALAPVNLGLAASLTNGRGARTDGDRADPLMQSAPDDLFAALMDKLTDGKSDVEGEEIRAEVARRGTVLALRHP